MLGAALIAISTVPRRAASREAGEPESDGTHPRPEEIGEVQSGRVSRGLAAAQQDQGPAAHPAEFPAGGWRGIAVRIYREFNEDRVLSVAAGVTFYTLLSLFPAIAALVSCYGLFADVSAINQHLSALQGVLPSGAIEIIGDQVKRIAAKGGGTLSVTFFTSLLLSLWSANAAMKAMFDALNIVYEADEKRNFFWLNLRSLAFTGGTLLVVILALSAIVVLPVVFNFIGLQKGAWTLALLRWPALFLVVLGGLSLLYRYGPSRKPVRWRWVAAGSTLAGLLWLAASILFSWYVANFGNYNETYGSLGAAIGFMTWIWISATIVLLGGEINAEIEHRTARDPTTAPAMPPYTRAARMADSVGAAA